MSDVNEQILLRAWHDLGAPLRAIKLLVDLTRTGDEPLGPQTLKHLDLIVSRAQRAERLIDQLLDYLNLDVKPEPREAVDTAEIADAALDEVRESGFEVHLAGQWPTASLPRKAFSHSVTELLTNAVKHHGSDTGQIRISARQDGQVLEIQVQDDGKGIDPRFHDEIFEFCKTLQSQDQIEGNGMGLTLIRRTLSHYGGEVGVDSAPGAGTTLTMRWELPMPEESTGA